MKPAADAERWPEILATFDNLIELPLDLRELRLRAIGTSDPELRRHLEALLAADSDADERLAVFDRALAGTSATAPQHGDSADPLGVIGGMVSHFRVVEPLASGGMGVVYRAEDIQLRRAVALKFPLAALHLDQNVKERFFQEARLAGGLDHPNLCAIYEAGETVEGHLFYAMPLYHGETLKSRLAREGALSVADALRITAQIAAGLSAAHKAGVVHRDLKPANVMLLPGGDVKILDFGLAKVSDLSLTQSQALIGTVSYMAPEQVSSHKVDGRTDLWALGVVLYEMLTGQRPFAGEHYISVAHAILHTEPERPRTLQRDLPAEVEGIVRTLLRKRPADRYSSADDLAAALAAIQRGEPSRAPLLSKRPQWALSVAAGAIVLALAAVGSTLVSRQRSERVLVTPDLVQLTTTGNATLPAISPDGTRFAFAERVCDANDTCLYQLVIQDMDGTGRLVLTGGIPNPASNEWTLDGRYLVFVASYGSDRWGVFAVSTLGGQPRRIGCCSSAVLAGDTVLLTPIATAGDTSIWVKLVTIRDGMPKDSFSLHNAGRAVHLSPTDDPGVFIASLSPVESGPAEVWLVDRRGNILTRSSAGLEVQGRIMISHWLSGRSAMLIGLQRQVGSRTYDFFVRSIEGRTITSGDTLLRGLEMKSSSIDVSRDGTRMLLASGPAGSSALVFEATAAGFSPLREIFGSTTRLSGQISPDGRLIAIVRKVLAAGVTHDQIWLAPFGGGEPKQLTPPVEAVRAFDWNPDGSGIVYLQKIGESLGVSEVDTAGARVREIMHGSREVLEEVRVLPDNRVLLMGPRGQRFQLIDRAGKLHAQWRLPVWLGGVVATSPSPDGKTIAMIGWDPPSDSLVVARIDVQTGRFSKLATVNAEWPGSIKWTSNGELLFDLPESSGSRALYSMLPDGRDLRRVSALPRFSASYTISADGKRFAAFAWNDKRDVYMIRNLADILKR